MLEASGSMISSATLYASNNTHQLLPADCADASLGSALTGEESLQEEGSLQVPDMPPLPISPWSNLSAFEDHSARDFSPRDGSPEPIPTQLGEPRKSGVPEAVESPFTPEDSPIYELCPDSPITKKFSPLRSVPEDEAASPPLEADMLQPEALQLPVLRTPRKAPLSAPTILINRPSENPETQTDKRAEERLSVDFSTYCSGDLGAFNPFASGEGQEHDMDAEEEVAVGTHEGRHSIGEDADSAFREAPPGLAHLDFGTRTGGGVVGPKLDRVLSGRQADKFEVKEGEDAEIKQLLWVIENLQEELHISNTSFGKAEQLTKERQAIVDKLEEELSDAKAHEAELREKLDVSHSQLEAQLLSNLEQEEDIRVSGELLKKTKADIVLLDEQLAEADVRRKQLQAEADIRRKQLKAEAATKREKNRTESLEKKAATTGKSENAGASEGSDGDSAWDESSESDAEGALDLDELQETRPSPTSVFEDNQAKMTEKGAKGGSWLRSVLGSMAKKDSVQDGDKRVVFGAAHSHFEQPSTAAELRPSLDEDVAAANPHLQREGAVS